MKVYMTQIKIFLISLLLGSTFLFAKAPEYVNWSEDKLLEEGFEKYAQTDSLELYLNKSEAVFAVRKISSGYVWYSSPLDWEEDDFASGYNKNALPSMLQINTKDRAGSFYPSNSYINSVKRKGFRVMKEEGGFTLNHNFPRDGFFIPLHVTLEDDSLVVKVYYSEIEEEEDDSESELSALSILDMTLLPYFGAAPEGEEGYIFVPDGCGSIIEFDNNITSEEYTQYVYGRDESIIPNMKKTVSEDIYLPVFGMKREGAGFIAVIEENKSNSLITARTAKQINSYNSINSKCIIRDLDTFTFRERTGTPRDIRIFQKRNLPESEEFYSIRYIFLDQEENSYVGMANAYRNYLQEKDLFPKEKTESKSNMTLNFIGAGTKQKAVLGIPMKVDIPFTPFNQVIQTIDQLKENGVDNFLVKYDGWINGGIFGKYPSNPKPSKKLGGNKDFELLLDYVNQNNIDFYTGADFVNLYQTDLSHIKELTANREINKAPVKVPDFRLSTFDEKTTGDIFPNWILRLPVIKKNVEDFLVKTNEEYSGLGLALDSLGNVLGSDFGNNGNSRDETARGFSEILTEISQTNPLLLSRPFDYALQNVSYITDLPIKDSSFELENYSVPFYQILIKGFIPFANLPLNRNSDLTEYQLKILETGSDISCMWICQNPEELRDSRLQSYTSIYAEDWKEDAVTLYNQLNPILEKIAGVSIVDHIVYPEDYRITKYENGIKILTNYSNKTVTVDGMTAQAGSYAIGEEE